MKKIFYVLALDNTINEWVNKAQNPAFIKIMVMAILIVGLAVALHVAKFNWLIVLLLEVVLIMIFFTLGWLQAFIIIIIGIILIITLVLTITRVRKYN